MENLEKLVHELISLPSETPWIEFKHNNFNPEMIGEDISALANSVALQERQFAYMLWGIDDSSHNIIGCSDSLNLAKVGNEELPSWLRRLLSANADFEYVDILIDGLKVGILKINKAAGQTVSFKKESYIRIGSYTKKLKDYPAIEAQLWERLKNDKFEDRIAKGDLNISEALNYLGYSTYFDLLGIPIPENQEGVTHYLLQDGILRRQDNGLHSITNLGAILFAKHLSDFPSLSRKVLRIVQYKGINKMEMVKEHQEDTGYVISFERIFNYLDALLPARTLIKDGLRTTETAYPPLAIREAVANALIHQDFTLSGAGPVIELFDNRIEITNPGEPIIDVLRIIDNPPRSRNEKLANLMRRMNICEELGSGWDKMVIACELMKLPAPRIDIYSESTRVTLFAAINFTNMSSEDRIWACYMHACIKFVQGEQINNQSVRERFGLKTSSSASISRLLQATAEKKLIKPVDANAAPRYMRYIPIWA